MGLWDDGRRAWERLDGWAQDAQPDDGKAALAALSDIGTVRRLLDRAELSAVRTARRHGKSWAEIATRLGVTRQSAWERWRDLDDQPDDVVSPTARQQRRQSSVVVPSVIGMSFERAMDVLTAVGLTAVSENTAGVVTDQTPEAGARVPAGSMVRLWVERDGGSGIREPRRPRPAPRSGRALHPEPSDDFRALRRGGQLAPSDRGRSRWLGLASRVEDEGGRGGKVGLLGRAEGGVGGAAGDRCL